MWTGKHTAILGGASVLFLAVGSASGWFLAQRTLSKKFDERLSKEVAATKAFYANMAKPDPEALAQMLLEEEEAPQKHQYNTTSDEVPQEVLERIANKMMAAEKEVEDEAQPTGDYNVFEDPASQSAWDQQDEELSRKNGVPYIISHDEFYENQWEFQEGHLTYYEGDMTLTDSRDEPIPDVERTVGLRAIDGDAWGYGSNDPNIVYVCNEQMEMVFEVARSTKSYAEDVLGFIEGGELKHGQKKFRQGRDE